MKIVSKDGKTWFKKNEDGSTDVGLTASFLNDLDGCWHMMQAASARVEVKEEQPLLSVETNDGLFSVKAPVAGVISFFANEALNFPDKIKEDTVVVMMKPYKKEEPKLEIDWNAIEQQQERIRLNLNQPAAAAQGLRLGDVYGQRAFFDEQPVAAIPQPAVHLRNGGRR